MPKVAAKSIDNGGYGGWTLVAMVAGQGGWTSTITMTEIQYNCGHANPVMMLTNYGP